MGGEGKNQDYKLLFDPSSERAKVNLVKKIVAIANAGGGRIIFGRDETNQPGIDESVVAPLDSSRISDLIEVYIKPSSINIGHETTELANGHFIHTIIISEALYPIVMGRQGSWKGMGKKENPLFQKGEIWTRHSSKTERVNFEDLRTWIDDARRKGREGILDQIQMVSTLPEGTEIRTVTKSEEPLTSPLGLLENQALMRDLNPNHLIEPHYINWLFINRNTLRPTANELSILIGSSLRRPSTLYWWLIDADENPELIVRELLAVLESSDRDKSDAAKSIVELASIYADDETLEGLISSLAESKYSHFNEAAAKWTNREDQINSIRSRIFSVTYNGERLMDQPFSVLQTYADLISNEMASGRGSHRSRQLANITKVMWFKRTKRMPYSGGSQK